ncbi:glycosyltransferase family 9 protein [Odoribacter lunatus]|uniref:glycosyltransferase family 9 protein n=1 Tax=Odoribacter lunatus TaxID=2941335 RepID=UPI00203D9F8F|nr:glycosyltransferase family 9 protein [Odoribacter lunatus]
MAPKFLIIRFSSIGDIIQCMDVINGIKNRFPDAEIHWIARKDMSSFLAMDKRIDHIWAFDKKEGLQGLLRMAEELKKEHFDYIYDAHSNIRSNILKYKLRSFFGKKPHIVLRRKERGKRFLLFKLGINRFPWPFRGRISYRKPLARWSITDFTSIYEDWHFPEEFGTKFSGLITPQTVTLVPSANWPKKRWPVGHWQKLIELLPEYRFVLLAGPADSFCDEIRNAAPERVLNLAGQTSLLESCYLVLHSRLVISADTGFMHAADLFKTPTLALIGPTAFGFPSGENSTVLELPLPCRPCTKDGSGKCKRETYQQCMADITPRQVALEVRRHLPV